MEKIPRGKYTKEFREEAVKLVVGGDIPLREVAWRLSMAPSTLVNWVKAYEAGKLGDVGKTYRPLSDIEMELARTKRELAETRMERDLLKKAAAYFARSRCPVRDDEEYAASISGADDVPSLSGICQRLLRLVGETAIEASP